MRKGKLTRQQKVDRYSRMIVGIVLKYYKDNNLGTSEKWTPTLDRYRVYKFFDKIIYERPRDEALDMNEAIKELIKVLPNLKRLYNIEKHSEDSTYGSTNDYDNLCYVSDRWYCSQRLLWLIELAERNEIYINVPEEDYPDQMTWEIV